MNSQYTEQFNYSFHQLMIIEGGKVVDHAGPTNWGITLTALQATGDLTFDLDRNGIVDKADLWMMPKHTAKLYVFNYWWAMHQMHLLVDTLVACKHLDQAYNMGPRMGGKLLQRAAKDCGRKLKVDGRVGPHTVAAVNTTDPTQLLAAMRRQQKGFYMRLIRRNPAKFLKYKNGWLRRAAR